MRKFLILCLSLLLLLLPYAGTALAAGEAYAEIPVVIEGGGTVHIIPEVNSPLPTETTLRVDNGRTGRIYIYFTEAGVYHYTITAEFSENGKTWKADDVYRLTVEVYEKEDGTLYTVSIINNTRRPDKGSLVQFPRTPETTTQPSTTPDTTTTTTTETTTTTTTGTTTTTTGTTTTTTTTTSTTGTTTTTTTGTTTPSTTKPKKPGTPRTGDESNLTRYVLHAVASSLGLFLLALLYTLNTNRLIKED